MTEDQFCAWLLVAFPVLACFFNTAMSLQERFIAALVVSIFPIMLFIIAENEFIKDCKKGYTDWEESILPQWFYKKVKK